MRRKIAVLLILGLALGMILLGGCTQQEGEVSFPQSSGEFEIQGLMWRSIAYYYFPSIYQEMYNSGDNFRLISKAKNAGANYLLVRAFYNCAEDGSLIGNDEVAEERLGEAIATAHNYGIKIFLTPFVESMEFWPERKWELSVEGWTEAVLKWARFAEENNVELFAPGFEMSLIMDKEDAREWFKAILPQIREVYSGKVAFAEIPYGEPWEFIDEGNAFVGYNCAGITIFPWKDYDGVHDMRSFDDFRSYVEEQANELDELAEKYDTDCRFVATLGMDFWYGEMPEPDIRAQGYEIALDVLKEHGVSGLFLHLWASEEDQLKDSTEVEDMLKARWTLSPSP
jgi:hypothetical protein